jgi:hypothetical protein
MRDARRTSRYYARRGPPLGERPADLIRIPSRWILRAYDIDAVEPEREFTLPAEFIPPQNVRLSPARSFSTPLSRFLAHTVAVRYGLPIPNDARIAFSLDFDEPGSHRFVRGRGRVRA